MAYYFYSPTAAAEKFLVQAASGVQLMGQGSILAHEPSIGFFEFTGTHLTEAVPRNRCNDNILVGLFDPRQVTIIVDENGNFYGSDFVRKCLATVTDHSPGHARAQARLHRAGITTPPIRGKFYREPAEVATILKVTGRQM